MRPVRVVAALALSAAAAPALPALAAAAAASAASTTALAASTAAQAGKREKGIPELFDGITLTAEQKEKIRSIHADYHNQMTGIKVTTKKRDNDGKPLPPTDKVKKQLADLEDKEHAALRAVLTPDQFATFDKNLAKEKEEMAKADAAKAEATKKP
jgi:Spy/CpxP family protein refolding chaperone